MGWLLEKQLYKMYLQHNCADTSTPFDNAWYFQLVSPLYSMASNLQKHGITSYPQRHTGN